jgi:hypothetical protein
MHKDDVYNIHVYEIFCQKNLGKKNGKYYANIVNLFKIA